MEKAALQDAIAALYGGPFADFIRARDDLARALRTGGDREAASAVKSLRKPSRPAWALDRIAQQQPGTLSALEDAVGEIVDAHAGKGDVRAAMATLREAVRGYATQAAEEARSAGFSLESGDLSNAVLAVLGNPDSWDELRRGQLVDVPEAGGLDFLAALPARPRLEVSSYRSAPAAPAVDPAEAAAAREQARLSTEAVERARAAAEAATGALADAETEIASAQEKLRSAESELKEALQRREFARRAKESAAAELRTAEAADQEAQRRLRSLSPG